ncbi:MAG: PD-(D/E)XK nuclease family transposase, partial [Treponemataceae bacterium]
NRLVVNIEMQQFWKSDFSQRIQMYLLNVGHRFLKKHPKPDEPLFAISLTVFGEKVPKTAELPRTSKGSILQYLYIDLNKLIGYTLDKDIDNYTAQDFWIRFLGNYQSDVKTKALKSLCEKNEGVNMANEVLLTVTEEERQIARELSEYKYQLMVQDEREEARNEGLAEGLLEGEKRGIQKGLNQGKLEKARETAKNLLQIGLSVEQISKVTGLSELEIAEL